MTEEAVILDVDYVDGIFELVLVNHSDEVARDVRVSFSGPIMGLGGDDDLAALNLWNRLETLRPGKEIRVLLDTGANVFKRGDENAFTATVTWQTRAGRQQARYRHDLEAYRGMPDLVRPPR